MFRRKSNNIISRILVFLMVMMTVLSYLPTGISPVVGTAEAVVESTVETHMSNTVSYYEENGSELDDWQVICALVGAGVDIHDSSKWTLPDWDTNTIETDDSASKYGSRMLALIAMDKNPENIWGRNLVEELVAKQDDETGSFGTIFDQMYAMHALEIVGADYDRDLAVEWTLSQQDTENGGFSYSAGTSDPDTTGMVLRVLGNYTSDSDVSNAVDAAVEYLKGIQLSTGGFASYGEENANTIAVIISGLASVGEDVQSAFWTENDNTIVDALYQFELGDYSYTWVLDPAATNGLSTTQSLAALGDVVAGDSGLNRLEYDADTISLGLRVEGISDTKLNTDVSYKVLNDSSPTVEEVIRYAFDEEEMSYEITTSAMGPYLEMVDGEASGTFDGWDGWLYLLNGESGMGIGTDTVEDGDDLVFYYGEYAPGTLIPEVSVSPDTIYAGDDITFTVTSTYDDWSTGSPVTTTEAIEFADIEIDGTVYTTDANGQATVTGGTLAVGTYDYRVTKDEVDAVPGILRTDGPSLTVNDLETTTVDLRIEGIADTIYKQEVEYIGYPSPTVADVLSYALDEEEISYEILDGDWGLYLNSVDGETAGTFEGWDGWLYLLNGESGMGIGYDTVMDGDELVFYYGEYAPGTLIPEVSVSPETIYVGDDIVFTVTSTYEDWSTGSPVTTTEAIDGAEIEIDGTIYTTDAEGQATVDGNVLSSGTYEYRVTKDESGSVPGILRTDWESLTVKKVISTSNDFQVYIAVIGEDGELLYGPNKVTISEDDEYGDTALGALDATGLDYDFDDDFPDMVDEIEGQENMGMNGWMYSVNGNVPSVLAGYKVVNSGAKVMWWYSDDPMGESPDWPSSSSSFGAATAVDEDAVKEMLEGYREELTDGAVLLNEDDMMSASEAEDLAEELEDNEVSLSGDYEGDDLVLSDDELSILVPEGAYDDDIEITVEEFDGNESTERFAVRIGSSVYDFGPDGMQFDEPVIISIKVPIYENNDLESLKPAWFDEENGMWITIPCVIDVETGMITFEIDHFTKFAVIETEARVEFADVDDTMAWARDAVEILAGEGVINGTGEGYEPQRSITRAEFVKIVVEALELEKAEVGGTIFTDVNADDWFAQYVECGYNNDIVTGDPDGSFRPNDEISRNEIAVVLSRLGDDDNMESVELAFDDVLDIPEWARPGVEFAYGTELMNGYEDNTFRGGNALSRAEAAVVVYRYMNYSFQKAAMLR